MQNLLIYTAEMKTIQSMNIGFNHSDNIVAITSSPTLIIDSDFLNEKMGQNPRLKSCPVKVMAVRADWIFQEGQGKRFLKTVVAAGDMDIYKIEAIQMIIEFLFMKMKRIQLWYVFPLHILQFYFFAATIILNELHIDDLIDRS